VYFCFMHYEHFSLANGLRVWVHEDPTTPLAVVNLLYRVGSRDESAEKTGFAHLFEHLMFEGSAHIPNFDQPLQRVGGASNAFTSPDLTNYYVSLPPENLETALWLESDRMLSLAFQEESLAVQKKVVIEEYKQRYKNRPYGDIWHHLREMAYKTHPYRWPTIGKTMQHVEEATLQDVKDFFYTYYRPNNAVLVIAGAVKAENVKPLVEKWFGEIAPQARPEAAYPQEKVQREARRKFVEADVPALAFYRAYPTCGRMDAAYAATDLLSDVLGRGKSSYLYRTLVREKALFSSFNAYVTGSADPGLLVLEGKLREGVSAAEAEAAIDVLLDSFCQQPPKEKALEKVKAQAETSLAFSELPLLNRAYRLAYGATFATPEWALNEGERLHAVSAQDVFAVAQNVLRPEAANTIWYGKKEAFTKK